MDYFLLNKVVRRMEWTWVTFPIIVLLFGATVWLIAGKSRSKQLQVNQVELIDFDAQSGTIRGTVWSSLYSPAATNYDLTFQPQLPVSGMTEGVLLSWQGLPGTGLGGMDGGSTALGSSREYGVSEAESSDHACLTTDLEDVPVQFSSSKAFQTRWWATTDTKVSSGLYEDPRERSLKGELTNPLDVQLKNCVIFYKNWAYRLEGPLNPDETVVVEQQTVERTRDGFLTRRRIVDNEDVVTPWDQANEDLRRISEVMMFYSGAGGKAYTGLTQRYQSFVDLTDQLQLDHAILVGSIDRPSGRLTSDDDKAIREAYARSRVVTFYRIVVPVQTNGSLP